MIYVTKFLKVTLFVKKIKLIFISLFLIVVKYLIHFGFKIIILKELHDIGRHVVCAIVTKEFLNFSKERGNDLLTPQKQYFFPGLKEGDRWCLCVLRWKEAFDANCAPTVDLEATNEIALKYVKIEDLIKHSYKSI